MTVQAGSELKPEDRVATQRRLLAEVENEIRLKEAKRQHLYDERKKETDAHRQAQEARDEQTAALTEALKPLRSEAHTYRAALKRLGSEEADAHDRDATAGATAGD